MGSEKCIRDRMDVEEEFGIEVADEDAEKLVAVGDITAHVEKATA